jgi:hypothetical protein
MLAERLLNWAKTHPILAALAIVVYFMATVNQDRAVRNFIVAAAVLVAFVAFLLLAARRSQRNR